MPQQNRLNFALLHPRPDAGNRSQRVEPLSVDVEEAFVVVVADVLCPVPPSSAATRFVGLIFTGHNYRCRYRRDNRITGALYGLKIKWKQVVAAMQIKSVIAKIEKPKRLFKNTFLKTYLY